MPLNRKLHVRSTRNENSMAYHIIVSIFLAFADIVVYCMYDGYCQFECRSTVTTRFADYTHASVVSLLDACVIPQLVHCHWV